MNRETPHAEDLLVEQVLEDERAAALQELRERQHYTADAVLDV